MLKKKAYNEIVSSVFAVALGLLFGLIVMLVSKPEEALGAFAAILTGSLTHGMKDFGQIFYYATPIICTGLSVGFAFKTGLFNIGATGQFTMGAYGAVYVGIMFPSLAQLHWVVALLVAVVLGALWGVVPGVLKAYANVNEVISSIMMNYIGMYLVNYLVKNDTMIYDKLRNQSFPVAKTANIPSLGLDRIFVGSNINGGIFIAIGVVLLVYVILNRTTIGFAMKAVGLNRDASKYAGIREKRCIIMSMVISGGLAGLAGGLLFLAGSGKHLEVVDVLATEGFTGISVALLGLLHPVGIFIASIFIAYITQGGFYMQLYDFAPEVIDMIVAIILYFSAFALLFKSVIGKMKNFRRRGGAV